MTSVTPARHRCLLSPHESHPPPHLDAATPPPPSRAARRPRVRVRAAAGLVRALWALCAARGAPAPRRTPGRPADKCSRLPRERARAGEADADAACDSGNPLRPTSHLSATAATTEEQREGGSEAGGGELSSARAGLRVAGCVCLASATPGSSPHCSLCAAAAATLQRLGGLRVSARGRGAADTLASRGKRRRAQVLWPRWPTPTAGSFICSWEPAADGGTLRPCAV